MKKMHLDTSGSRWGVATDNLPKLMKLFAKLESLNVANTGLDKLSEPLLKTMMYRSNFSKLDISKNDLSYIKSRCSCHNYKYAENCKDGKCFIVQGSGKAYLL
jgi:hypothetical protein